MKYSKNILHKLLSDMQLIRGVQLAIESRYLDNEMKTPVHLCIGQEAVAAGVCAHLKKKITSAAITGDMDIIWPKAVIYGR